MTNSTLMMTTMNEIEEYDGYDGPAFDVVSIVFVSLLGISCIACICMNHFSDHDSNRNICCAWLFWINILMLGLALNLFMRYMNDQCSYDPNATCTTKRYLGKLCSNSCMLLFIFGIILINISGLFLVCYVFAWLQIKELPKEINTNERTKGA